MANDPGLDATLGNVPANTGRDIPGPPADKSFTSEGSSGNPGLANPWEGADATPKPGELPPLKSL